MIYFTGDTHGEFERLGTRYINADENDTVIICGDFGGVWDDSAAERYWRKWLASKPFTILFVKKIIFFCIEFVKKICYNQVVKALTYWQTKKQTPEGVCFAHTVRSENRRFE